MGHLPAESLAVKSDGHCVAPPHEDNVNPNQHPKNQAAAVAHSQKRKS